jgi:hypothetical protein
MSPNVGGVLNDFVKMQRDIEAQLDKLKKVLEVAKAHNGDPSKLKAVSQGIDAIQGLAKKLDELEKKLK